MTSFETNNSKYDDKQTCSNDIDSLGKQIEMLDNFRRKWLTSNMSTQLKRSGQISLQMCRTVAAELLLFFGGKICLN